MQEPNYSGFTGVGGSPSPNPASYHQPPASHVTNPESQPFLPSPLYPATSKSVLSYMGAASHMPGSSLLTGQPPSPTTTPTWQSSPPSSATQVLTLANPHHIRVLSIRSSTSNCHCFHKLISDFTVKIIK